MASTRRRASSPMGITRIVADSDSESEHVVDHIQRLHEVCHSAGVPSVILSVPPSLFAKEASGYGDKYDEVNFMLQEWARGADATAESQGVLGYINTEALLPYSEDSLLWDRDGLHFSRAGSLHFGAQLAERLRPLLRSLAGEAGEQLEGDEDGLGRS
eukprot:CAMPEP_0115718832 /NCGR_PEP_ID=MMETSP0272-20121206/77650_1 /TAXON_ID=71861 /ORGANISM="Scrippsiella trochoidea, Strain CCMP3099" /LENGTH=157 /DNA_ID=CAMNT_0003161405 /DNA_START=15 /DNA_END=488 /DNA_ORIENTATION=+